MNKKAYDTDTVKMVTVNWFAVAGVILGAIVANVVTWGIASINGMAVAAVCYVIGELVNINKMNRDFSIKKDCRITTVIFFCLELYSKIKKQVFETG